MSATAPLRAETARRGPLPLARAPAWLITAALGAGYLLLAPQSPDLAAASYRSWLFSQHGFALWDNGWFGGHHLAAYSLLAPPLGALLGGRLLAALSMTAAAALFAALVRGRFTPRAERIAACWFALGAGIQLLSSRVPYDLGLAVALASLLLALRGRRVAALAPALLCAAASPVASAFLALAYLAWALTARARAWPVALTLAALAPIALLELLFPEGGTQPFDPSAFWPALVGVLAIAALIPREGVLRGEPLHVLRTGALLYAAALVAAFAMDTAVGGNADRLGALCAGPVAALALADSTRVRRIALAVLAPALLYWQANAPVADLQAAESSAAVNASYYAPLIAQLRARDVGDAPAARIEVVPTAVHWEARFLAPRVMLARGWERQLDRLHAPLFYEGAHVLAPARYRAWLDEQGVSYVALPDAPLDYSGVAEARLISARTPAYLREVWRSRHWRLFAVTAPAPLVRPAGRLASVGGESFSLSAPRAGTYTVLMRFTPYWRLAAAHGCVSRAPGEWTRVHVSAAGTYDVRFSFSLGRVLAHGSRCG